MVLKRFCLVVVVMRFRLWFHESKHVINCIEEMLTIANH